MLRELVNAAIAFGVVFLLYGIISSSYLASHGFTYSADPALYVAGSAIVYLAIGACAGLASGVASRVLGALAGTGLRGVSLQWAFHSVAAVSVFVFLHGVIRFFTSVLYVQDGPENRQHLTAWSVGLLMAYALLFGAVWWFTKRRKRSGFTLAVTCALVILAASAALWTHLGARSISGTARDNVFIISVDTLGSDHLNAFAGARASTPALDAIARDGIVFKRAFGTAPYTWSALSSVLTGRFTINHGVRVNGWQLSSEEHTLVELFRENGFVTAGVSDIGFRWLGYDQGFDELLRDGSGIFELQPFRRLLPGITWFSNWFASGQGDITSSLPQTLAALRWLTTLSRPQRNFFWIHFYDDAPHEPYTSPEPYASMYVPASNQSSFDGGFSMLEEFNRGASTPNSEDRAKIEALYDGEITWCDRQIASLVNVLHEKGLYDEATILVVADHGQMFGRRNAWGHGEFLFNSLLHVPLIIKPPRAAGFEPGRVVKAPVSTVDILPTLAELYELPLTDDGLDGESLVPFMRDGEYPEYRFWHYAETLLYDRSMKPLGGRGRWRVGYAIMDENWKAIAVPASNEFHLYALDDLDEEHPIEDPDRIREMEEQAARYFGLSSPAGLLEVAGSEISDDTRERLEALGYLLQ